MPLLNQGTIWRFKDSQSHRPLRGFLFLSSHLEIYHAFRLFGKNTSKSTTGIFGDLFGRVTCSNKPGVTFLVVQLPKHRCWPFNQLGLQVTKGQTAAIPCWLDCLHRSHKDHEQQPVHKTTRRRQNRWFQRCLH